MDLEKQLTDIDKKLSKILNLQTKIAKALHLIPVTPKEEKELQLLQRKNSKLVEEVYDELDKMSNSNSDSEPSEFNLFSDTPFNTDVFGDCISDDFLDDYRKTEV